MEAVVLEEPRVVGEADPLLARAAEPRVGEGQAQPLEQGIEAVAREEQEARGQEGVRDARLTGQTPSPAAR